MSAHDQTVHRAVQVCVQDDGTQSHNNAMLKPIQSVRLDENGSRQQGMHPRDPSVSSQSNVNEIHEANDDNDAHANVPACLVRFRDCTEACSHSLQDWADKQEVKANERKAERRKGRDGGIEIAEDGRIIEPKGDTVMQRKGVIPLVIAILTWVEIVYVWRICVNAIKIDTNATATRNEGIGLLVSFQILWLMTMWCYIKVNCTGPGYVRDHVPITEPPSPSDYEPFPKQDSQAESPLDKQGNTSTPSDPSGFQHGSPSHDASLDGNTKAKDREMKQSAGDSRDVADASIEEPLDSSVAAALSPFGVGLMAQIDETTNIVEESKRTAASCEPNITPAQIADRPAEPMRAPQLAMPLHPINTYCWRCKRHKPPRAHHCRHCGTCVLKMDHHCPWVGGCVGARNHKFFFNFLQWVTALEIFVLISNAIMFHRGLQRAEWKVDGYMISLFPIAGSFALFTTALLITHSYLFTLNLTTIEHLGYDRQSAREAIIIEDWIVKKRKSEGKSPPSWFDQLREQRQMKAKWDKHWGQARTEANLYWLDGRRWASRIVDRDGIRENDDRSDPLPRPEDRLIHRPLQWYHGFYANWRQVMGTSPIYWILPIGRSLNAEGLSWECNWRFGKYGEWTARDDWTTRLGSEKIENG